MTLTKYEKGLIRAASLFANIDNVTTTFGAMANEEKHRDNLVGWGEVACSIFAALAAVGAILARCCRTGKNFSSYPTMRLICIFLSCVLSIAGGFMILNDNNNDTEAQQHIAGFVLIGLSKFMHPLLSTQMRTIEEEENKNENQVLLRRANLREEDEKQHQYVDVQSDDHNEVSSAVPST